MSQRDLLSVIGAVMYLLGTAMKAAPPTATMYWLAQIFEGVGGTLGIGGRALITAPAIASSNPKPKRKR